jgi:uncharacterized protein (DUF1697 family)
MTRHIALLRGINVGKSKRIAMPQLREALSAAGFAHVTTYIASGNIILESNSSATAVATKISTVIFDQWGFDVPVVTRTFAQLQEVIAADPFDDVATDAKHYSVTFFDSPLPADTFDNVDRAQFYPEQFELRGAELFTWTPDGMGRSPLMQALGKVKTGATGTNRNWRTITKLVELALEE